MLSTIPRHLPTLPALLDDLGIPSASTLAKILDVSRRTAERWIAAEHAPRAAMLALFWVSRWGRSEAETQAHNAATLAAAQVRCLRDENAALRAECARLAALSCYGAANSPSWEHFGRDHQPQQHARRDGGQRVG